METCFKGVPEPRDMPDFKKLIRTKISQEVLGCTNKFKILVLDERTVGILSCCMKLFELMDESVVLIEKIQQSRKKFSLDGVYFLSPTKDSVEGLVGDFSSSPQYSRAHVVFTGPLPETLLKKLSSGEIMKHLVTFKELFLDFFVPDGFVFHFGMQESFVPLYKSENAAIHIQMMANRLMGVCAAMDELPTIKFSDQNHPSLAEQLAIEFQKRLEECLENGTLRYPKISTPRATILLLDRRRDLVSPVVHEFTYQAMATDLLNERFSAGQIYKHHEQNEEKELVLDDEDEIWQRTRYVHIAEVIGQIINEFNEFREQNKAALRQSGHDKKVANIKDLKQTLADIPRYQEMKTRFSAHIGISQACMKRFNEEKLGIVGMCEQNMATGLTPQGEEIDDATRFNDIVPLITDQNISSECKARLLILYLLTNTRKLTTELDRILSYANLTKEDADAIRNLFTFKDIEEWEKFGKPVSTNLKDESLYELSRHIPSLKIIVDKLIQETEHPNVMTLLDSSIVEQLIQQAGGSNPQSLRRKSKTPRPTLRLIVYVIGGITYSEIRSMHELMAQNRNVEIVIGSTHIITPQTFIHDLASLSGPLKGSKKRRPIFGFRRSS